MGEAVLAQGTAIALRLGRSPLAIQAPSVVHRRRGELPTGAQLRQLAFCLRLLPALGPQTIAREMGGLSGRRSSLPLPHRRCVRSCEAHRLHRPSQPSLVLEIRLLGRRKLYTASDSSSNRSYRSVIGTRWGTSRVCDTIACHWSLVTGRARKQAPPWRAATSTFPPPVSPTTVIGQLGHRFLIQFNALPSSAGVSMLAKTIKATRPRGLLVSTSAHRRYVIRTPLFTCDSCSATCEASSPSLQVITIQKLSPSLASALMVRGCITFFPHFRFPLLPSVYQRLCHGGVPPDI